MYDERQHLDLFHGPGQYLFRGSLPSDAYSRPYQGLGITPTSVDPIVATLFACRYRMEGPAIVLIAQKSDFTELLDGPNLASFSYEFAVNIQLPPVEFEKRCIQRVSLDESLAIVHELGYVLPSTLHDLGALTQALTLSPRMLLEEIAGFTQRCQQLAHNK